MYSTSIAEAVYYAKGDFMNSSTKSSDWLFIEIWLDMGLNPPYLFNSSIIEMINIKTLTHKKIIRYCIQHNPYEEARYWLVEDEYQIVDGRIANE